MIMPRKETCSLCGKEYQANCMVMIPPICDECYGVEPRKDPNKINSPEEFREAIKAADNKRYGNTAVVQERLRQKISSLTNEERLRVMSKIFDLAAEDVANMSDEEIEQELAESKVDTQDLRERLLNAMHKGKYDY